MIDALFGSKTRVKLLRLFLSNPEKSYYVREITRLVDEQINSVRRELSNMIGVGIVSSETADNKLYYKVNQRYEYYLPLRSIFGIATAGTPEAPNRRVAASSVEAILSSLTGARVIIVAGVLVQGSTSSIDVLVVGAVPKKRLLSAIKQVETVEGRDLNYTELSYDDFYYRLSIRDRFVAEILQAKHKIILDSDNVIRQ